jgi:hypothetical protein
MGEIALRRATRFILDWGDKPALVIANHEHQHSASIHQTLRRQRSRTNRKIDIFIRRENSETTTSFDFGRDGIHRPIPGSLCA